MKKNAKRLLAIILAATLLLGAVPFIASAETSGDLIYTVESGYAVITGIKGDNIKDLVIPEEIDGYKVSKINALISFYKYKIESVSIPADVSIENNAFEGFTNLNEILLPESLEDISSSAFKNTGYYNNADNWEDGVLYIGKYLISADNQAIPTDYIIKEGTKYIAGNAFSGCSKLRSVTIPDTVIKLCKYAFENCGSLTSVVVSEGVKSVGQSAFSGCYELEDITLPDSIINIGFEAFYETKYYNDSDNWEDGVLYINNHLIKMDNYEANYINPKYSYIIKDGTKSIAASAFWNCINLHDINIPKSVVGIGDSAFEACQFLNTISTLENVVYLGAYAFNGCKNLTSIILPSGIDQLGTSTFLECENIEEITIPGNVKEIGSDAFAGCTALKKVVINNGVEYIDGGAFSDCNMLAELTLPNTLIYIDAMAFSSCQMLTEITMPNSVKEIGNCAFERCAIKNIDIPESVIKIGEAPFRDCEDLEMINVSEANENYSSLDGVLFNKDKTVLIQYPMGNTQTSYILPDSVIKLGGTQFHNCRNLESVNVSENSENFSSLDGVLFNKDKTVLIQYPIGNTQASYIVPDSVKTIESYAFRDGDNLTEIYIGKNVSYIDSDTFSWHNNLETVCVASDNTVLSNYAFYGTTATFIVKKGNSAGETLASQRHKVVTFDTDDTYKPDGEKEAMPVLSFHGELKFGTELSEMMLSKLVKDADKDICFAYFESLDFSEYPEFVDALKSEGFDMEDMEYRFEDLIVGIKLFDGGVRFMPLKEGEDDGPMNIFEAIGKFIMEQIFIPLAAGLQAAVAFVLKLFRGK